jgi:hypothetical protein
VQLKKKTSKQTKLHTHKQTNKQKCTLTNTHAHTYTTTTTTNNNKTIYLALGKSAILKLICSKGVKY